MTRKAWAAGFLVLLIAACITWIAVHWRASEAKQYTYAAFKPRVTMAPVAWPDGLVNVNTADALRLGALDGLNQAQIEALLMDRAENGTFDFPEDLVYVKGIGKKTLAKIWDQLDFSWRDARN